MIDSMPRFQASMNDSSSGVTDLNEAGPSRPKKNNAKKNNGKGKSSSMAVEAEKIASLVSRQEEEAEDTGDSDVEEGKDVSEGSRAGAVKSVGSKHKDKRKKKLEALVSLFIPADFARH